MITRIGVIGCGAWGITVAKICAENQLNVSIWCHHLDFANEINSHQADLLPGILLPETLQATTDLKKIVTESDYLIIAVASNYIQIMEQIKDFYKQNTPLLVLTKGLLENQSTLFVSDYIKSILGQASDISILSGPNIAIEIAARLPAASVIASESEEIAIKFQSLLSNSYFRVYRSSDMKGVILGGILKNVIAIAAGAIDGLGLGTNAKSALMARGLQEMIRLGIYFQAKSETFFGLSGLGDLITTCSSTNSRNWQAGFQIAKHQTIPDFSKVTTQIAEGVKSARIIHKLAQEVQIEMPITSAIYKVLYETKPIYTAIHELMQRTLKAE